MRSVVQSATEQAEILRREGNDYFNKERIEAAMEAYTQAITLCPNVVVYWTNRALCHLKRNDWTKVEEDCRRAIELDSCSVKAHYMMGLALLQKQEYTAGVKELEKALELGRGANDKVCQVEQIWQELAKAKYLEWEEASAQRAYELHNLKEMCEKALSEQYLLDSHSKEINQLKDVFHRAAKNDEPNEVPDYLCCKITLDILRDPVLTPSGITYERSVLLYHLHKVGKFDPVTRIPLDEHQLVPNFAIKEAVQAFLNDHGWAYNIN